MKNVSPGAFGIGGISRTPALPEILLVTRIAVEARGSVPTCDADGFASAKKAASSGGLGRRVSRKNVGEVPVEKRQMGAILPPAFAWDVNQFAEIRDVWLYDLGP